jgi:D-tyrosyl-tRNA(Tyr) deacylase
MIGLLQRVTHAQVAVGGVVIAEIGRGALVLIGVEAGDSEQQADRLLERVLGYRVFPDEEGRMNRSLRDVEGSLLLVPQFTLAADTRKGARPSFSTAAAPEASQMLFEHITATAQACYQRVACGRFGADMKVTLTNDGPVTFWLRVAPAPA